MFKSPGPPREVRGPARGEGTCLHLQGQATPCHLRGNQDDALKAQHSEQDMLGLGPAAPRTPAQNQPLLPRNPGTPAKHFCALVERGRLGAHSPPGTARGDEAPRQRGGGPRRSRQSEDGEQGTPSDRRTSCESSASAPRAQETFPAGITNT